MGCDSIAIKDMAGLLTPYVTAELVKAIKDRVELPLNIHSHATSGLAAMCHLKAIENGCEHVDTAVSSFAGGTSHPPTESLVAALRGTEHDTGLDLEQIQEIGMYFLQVRQKYHQFESAYTGVDTRVQVNQVPGGMISNLANQLKEQNALDRMNEVLEEIPRVRKDLGYPPLVTPTSQIVGTQAVLNVLTGKRYQSITNEVKRYLQGGYGKPPAAVNPTLQQEAVGREEVIDVRPADLLKPELERLREDAGALAKSEEDVLTYAMFPEIGRQFLEGRAAGTLVPEPLEPPVQPGEAKVAPTEFNIVLHGESYHIKVTGAGHKEQSARHFYFSIDGLPEEVLVETLDEIVLEGGAQGAVGKAIAGKRPRPSKEGDVTTSMPGNIVDVLVAEGDTVAAGQAVLITEAMKMETEIQAPIGGTVTQLYVKKGDSVNPDEVLLEIEA
jgi:pyruvate carboxylase subunit B